MVIYRFMNYSHWSLINTTRIIIFLVPPDLFLLGCVFVVVELEDFLEEKIPGWQQKIAKHGGKFIPNTFGTRTILPGSSHMCHNTHN